MTVWTVAISKGGSGKTTTAAELVAGLAAAGRRVLAIDLDQQGNFSRRLGMTADTQTGTSAEVLAGTRSLEDAAAPSPSVDGADVIAGTNRLAELEGDAESLTVLSALLPRATRWDDVVIDTPPSLGLLTRAGLIAADVVVAAVEAATEAYDELDRLVAVIANQVTRLRPGQRVHWIIPTKVDMRRLADADVVELLEREWPGQTTTRVRQATAVKDSYTAGLPVSLYDAKASVSQDYKRAIDQIIATPTPDRRD